jgi:general secretion pathway protein D
MMHENKKLIYILFMALMLSFGGCAYAQVSDDMQDEQNLIEAAREMRSTGRIQLNFKDLEMAKFIHFMSELLGENIIVDPSVGGKVSVVSPRPISIKESKQVMLSVLEMNNLAMQDMGGYSKVLPLSAGPTIDNMVVKGDQNITPGEALTVQVVPLKYVRAGYIVGPLKSAVPAVSVTPLGSGRSVLLAGKASVLNRSCSVIRALDAPDSIRSIKIFSLAYANPKIIEAQMNAMAKDESSKLAGLLAIGDERTNRIIIVGSGQSLRESERILKGLDVPSKAENFHVYRLANADAKTVAEQLSQILAVAAKLSPDPKGVVPSTVVPDLPTNSLIFTATQEQFNSLKEILSKLDTQPKQVLLRGLIAEVNLNKLNSAGIDWAAWGGAVAGDAVIAGSAQLGTASVPSDIISLYQSLITKEEIYTDPVTGNTYQTTNTDGKGLIYAYVKLLNKFDAINVLSMPRLMCTDNLPSHLQVGQVIPQMKGSLTDTTNPGAVQNSYEYKDVGLILNVTPHVRSGNLVALEIEQRVEDLLTTTGSTTPVTSKREIKTNVLVANGQTIILGGLIREAEKALRNRVPFFSYIPIIGNIFKSNEKQREKVDLMIFLTPYILETPAHASSITNEIISGGQNLSEAEMGLLERNHTDYEKSVKQQGISKEMLDPNNMKDKSDKNPDSQTGPEEVVIK